jgi:superoxide dismutase
MTTADGSRETRASKEGGFDMAHKLLPLRFGYDALEPYIDAETMELHHDKHHGAYVDNLNKALEPYPQLAELTIEDLLRHLDEVPETIRTAVRNNGGGHANHQFFWDILGPCAARTTSVPGGRSSPGMWSTSGSATSWRGPRRSN